MEHTFTPTIPLKFKHMQEVYAIHGRIIESSLITNVRIEMAIRPFKSEEGEQHPEHTGVNEISVRYYVDKPFQNWYTEREMTERFFDDKGDLIAFLIKGK